MPALFILIPFFLLVILNLPFKFLKREAAFWSVAALLFAQVLLSLLHPLFSWSSYPDLLRSFFVFDVSVDTLTLILLLTIGIVALVSLLVARSMIAQERQRFNFINLLLVSLIGMNAIVLVRDLFSLYVFVEVAAVASFVLIAMDKDARAIEGAFKYLMLSAVATVLMLSAIAFFLLVSGDVSFRAIHGAFSNGTDNFLLTLAVGLFLCGVFIKSGIVPFHAWVLDAYTAAPAPVSVLLAGIVTKVSGVYVALRLFSSVFILSPSLQHVLLFFGAFSIVFAALAALTQDDFKRMLAYSSISQIGYIVLALGCATPLAFAGAVFHFFNHAIFKSLLFVNAASLEKQLGTTDMHRISGVGSKMPVTGVTSLVGLLSMAGIPPLAGFWSKLIIIIALFNSGKFVYASVALLASVLTLAYFLSFERRVFFCKTEPTLGTIEKTPFGIRFSEVVLTIITVGIGVGCVCSINILIGSLKDIFH